RIRVNLVSGWPEMELVGIRKQQRLEFFGRKGLERPTDIAQIDLLFRSDFADKLAVARVRGFVLFAAEHWSEAQGRMICREDDPASAEAPNAGDHLDQVRLEGAFGYPGLATIGLPAVAIVHAELNRDEIGLELLDVLR